MSNELSPSLDAPGALLFDTKQIGRKMKLFRHLAISAAMLLVLGSAMGAGSFRFLRVDPGQRDDTFSDDLLRATRLKWRETAPKWTLFRDMTSRDPQTLEQGVIIPIFNQDLSDPRFVYTQARVMEVVNKSIAEWNDVGSGFDWSSTVIPSDQWAGFDPNFPQGPTQAALDRYNLITFQDPSVVLAATDPNFVPLAVTSIWYFNQDVDLSDINNLPPFAITGDLFDAIVTFGPQDLQLIRLQREFYPAGSIIDTDIVFNQNLVYQIGPDDPPTGLDREFFQIDVQAITTHEMGHAAGLAHSQLEKPTMAPVVGEDVWYNRNLDFDDKLSIKMAYHKLFDKLGKGAITGRVLNGDPFDGVFDSTGAGVSEFITDIENTPVFIGRPTDETLINGDQLSGVDQTTSITNRIRFFAQVLNSQQFTFPLGINSPISFDSRYFIPNLPSSTESLRVGDGLDLAPNGYVLFIQPGFGVDDLTINFPPLADLIPPEFWGGAEPYFQPGLGNTTDPQTLNDFLVQDNWLQFAFTRLGQFSLSLAQSTFSLIDDFPQFPTESYITYRIVKNGVTLDVPNFQNNNIQTAGWFALPDPSGHRRQRSSFLCERRGVRPRGNAGGLCHPGKLPVCDGRVL
jgi:hypothetical protein